MDLAMDVLCDTHVIPVLMFLREHGESGRTEIYRGVSKANNMPRKLDMMEDAGLIASGAGRRVRLTPLGESVASTLSQIEEVLARVY